MTSKIICLALVLLSANFCDAATLPILRLRGGKLTKEQIMQKLDRVPVFSIVNAEGIVVPLVSAVRF